MILLVSYDLKGPAASYAKFYELLKAQPKWAHYLASTWLLKTTKTTDQLAAEIKPLVLSGDRILLIKVDPEMRANGLMPKDAWEWINREYTDAQQGALNLR